MTVVDTFFKGVEISTILCLFTHPKPTLWFEAVLVVARSSSLVSSEGKGTGSWGNHVLHTVGLLLYNQFCFVRRRETFCLIVMDS